MTRTRRFVSSAILGYTQQATIILFGLWLTPFLLSHLGEHAYGLWLVGLQILSYLMLADFGIVALLPRTVAYAVGRAGSIEAATDLPSILGETAVVVLCQTVLVGLAAGVIWILLPRDWSALRGPIGLVMAGVTLLFPCRIFGAVLEGLQEQAFVIRANMLAWGISTTINVAAVLAGWGLYALAIGWLLSQMFSAAACAFRLRKHFPGLLPRQLPAMRPSEAIPQLGRGFWISANQVGQVLMAGSDILIISKILGPAFAVPYSCTGKLANVLANQPQLLMHLAVPALSELKAGASKERVYQVCISLSQGMMLVSGMAFCVILLVNGGFVRWWVGVERYAGLNLAALILVQMIIRHFTLCFIYGVFCFGYERRLAVVALLDGLVTAGATLALTPWLGLIGPPIGSITGVCLVSLPFSLNTLARELEVSVACLVSPLWPWFWRFALLSGGFVLIAKNWEPRTIIQIAATALVVAVVYLAVAVRPIMQSALGPYLTQEVAHLQRLFRATRLTRVK